MPKGPLMYVVPTSRVKVPAGRNVVPTGKDNVIVSTSRTKVIPAGVKIYLGLDLQVVSEPVFSVSTSEPVFESPNSQTSQNTQSQQQFQQYHITTVSNNNAKFPYLKKDEYETWAMKMEYWIMNSDHNLWNIVLNGNSRKKTGRDLKGNIMILPPVSGEEHIVVQRETKARTILLQSFPEDHMANFHHLDDARDIWLAVKAKFGGNDESKKIRKSMLKQEFSEFRVSESEGLHKGYDRFQKILSQLNQMQAKPDNKDWGLEYLSFDDLYNKLRTFEINVNGGSSYDSRGISAPTHSAFISAASTNSKMSYADSQNQSPSITFTTASSSTDTSSNIGKLDLEELDIKWQMAMLSVRINRFEKKARRKIKFNNRDAARFDKKKVKCYKCSKLGHFARECIGKPVDLKGEGYSAFKLKELDKSEEPKALLSVDSMLNCDVSDAAAEFAFMGLSSHVHTCPFGCEHKYAELKKDFDNLEVQYKDCYIQVKLEKMNDHVKLEESKAKFDKWKESSKNLVKLMNSSMSSRSKFGLGYGETFRPDEVFDPSAPSIFDTTPKDVQGKPLYDTFVKVVGMHAVPSPITGTFMPPSNKPDLDDTQVTYGSKSNNYFETNSVSNDFVSCDNSDKSSDSETTGFASCVSSVKSSSSKTNEHLASASSSVDFKTVSKTVAQEPSSTIDDPSFSFKENVKTPRNICNKSGITNRSHCKNNSFGSKTCFVCGSKFHLIKDCDFYEQQLGLYNKPLWHNVAKIPSYVPRATYVPAGSRNPPAYVSAGSVFPAGSRNRPSSVSVGRPFSVGWRNPASRTMTRPTSHYFQHFRRLGCYKQLYIDERRWGTADNPHKNKDLGIVDSGCSRSMTGNKEKLDDFVKIIGGTVTFGGGDGKITGKGTIRTSKLNFENVYYVEELQNFNFHASGHVFRPGPVWGCDKFQLPENSQVVLIVPRRHNLYNFNLTEIQPERDINCLLAKASFDESIKWHRRMAHVNFKNINKLAKHGLVNGLPTKLFTNEQNYRLFLAFASYMGFMVYQMDVKSAFLYGEIDEEVYVSQPKGFEDPHFPKHVLQSCETLYSVKSKPLWLTIFNWQEYVAAANFSVVRYIIHEGSLAFFKCYSWTVWPSFDDKEFLSGWISVFLWAPELGSPAILATIDRTPYTITEDIVRRQLQLGDDGVLRLAHADYIFGCNASPAQAAIADEGTWEVAPAVPQIIPETIQETRSEPDLSQEHLPTPPRTATTDQIPLVFEQGHILDPNIASFSGAHESDPDLFTSTNVEDETLGGSFHTTPPRSTQVPPEGPTSGGAEDLATLTALSSLVSELVQKVITIRIRASRHTSDVDPLIKLATAAAASDAYVDVSPGTDVPPSPPHPTSDVSTTKVPTDVPSVGAPTGPSTVSPGSTTVPNAHKVLADVSRLEMTEIKEIDTIGSWHLLQTTQCCFDILFGCLQANPDLSSTIFGVEFPDDDFAARMAELVNTRRKELAKQRAKERRERPMTPSQLRQIMRTSEESRAVAFTRGLKRDGSPMSSASSKKLKTGDDEVNVEAPYHGVPHEAESATPSRSVSREEVAAPPHSQDILAAQVEVPSWKATIEDVEAPSNLTSITQHTASSLKKVGTKKKRLGRKGIHTSQSTILIEEGDPDAKKTKVSSVNAFYKGSDNSRKYFIILGNSSLYLLEQTDYNLWSCDEHITGLKSSGVGRTTQLRKKQKENLRIQSWKLYSFSGVHVLETIGGLVLHMFVDKKYPLSINLVERMLDHQLEIYHGSVGNELTTAVQLLPFSESNFYSNRPKDRPPEKHLKEVVLIRVRALLWDTISRTEYQLADMFTKALSKERFEYLVGRLSMRRLTLDELEVLANESA
ncbi:putative ribonuclease H-like domain-containing protein [Tanacetum coccineum]